MAEPIRITKCGKPSSPEIREAARARLAEIRQREAELRLEQHNLSGWDERLIEAAQFVVDVQAGPPSLGQLQAALDAAKQSKTISAERRELMEETRQLEGNALHYQWRALRAHWGPIPMATVVAMADSRAELKAKLANGKQE